MKCKLNFIYVLFLFVLQFASTKNEANAFTLIYDSASSGSGEYVYDLELAPDETIYNLTDSPFLGFADVLNFTDLAGVTSVTTSGIYSVVGFDDTTVNLEVATTRTNSTVSTIILDNIVTFLSDFAAGIVNFDATFDEGDGFQFGNVDSTITGPVATTTPEPSMILGLGTLLVLGVSLKIQKKQKLAGKTKKPMNI